MYHFHAHKKFPAKNFSPHPFKCSWQGGDDSMHPVPRTSGSTAGTGHLTNTDGGWRHPPFTPVQIPVAVLPTELLRHFYAAPCIP